MIDPVPDPMIQAFYRDRYDEDQRLVRSGHGRLEFARTQELLRRHLPPPPGRILDVGGGTGAHARWLAADGYDVHLIDPVPEHVRQALDNGGDHTAAVGDARSLKHGSGLADATLLLGPLYHLDDPADRAQALSEAVRATRPGGLIATAAISRYAAILELGANGRLGATNVSRLTAILKTGHHPEDPAGFTSAYMHRPEELHAEMIRAGLHDVVVLGVEGPSAPALDNAPPEALEQLLPAAVLCARMLESDPAMMCASPHLMGLGWIPTR